MWPKPSIFLKILYVSSFEREREREKTAGGTAEGEGEASDSRNWWICCQKLQQWT